MSGFFNVGVKKDLKPPMNILEGAMDVVSYTLMTSSNIMRLNVGKRNHHWCTLVQQYLVQLITTCPCVKLFNKCSSQFRVLFAHHSSVSYLAYSNIQYSGGSNTEPLKPTTIPIPNVLKVGFRMVRISNGRPFKFRTQNTLWSVQNGVRTFSLA